jgi:sulfatase maturation enzyme AslB (radical SAM superfamily)
MEKTYKNCQSCAMPLKKDPQGSGTNADGSKSQLYCSYCYENGKFHSPDMTAKEMQELVKEKLKEMKFPGFVAWFFASGIPRLERWKTKSR